MRSAGFPCRLAGCRRAFHVADQTSMEALGAASAARTAHEITQHGYHHVRLSDEPSVSPYFRRRPTVGAPRRR
jgi:hypothetical protein